MFIKESIVTVQPTSEPIAVLEAKAFLKVDGTEEDTMISSMITTVREWVELRTGRSLITQTRVLNLDYFPCGDTIELPNGKTQSITTVKYYNTDDSQTTLSSSDYWTDLSSKSARIKIKNYWPATMRRLNAVEITYVCGYGVADDIPRPLRSAMLLLLGHLYEHREDNTAVRLDEIPFGVDALVQPYIIVQDAFY